MKKYSLILFLITFHLALAQDSKDLTEFYIDKICNELKENSVDEFFVVKHIQYGTFRIVNINDKDYCDKEGQYYTMYVFWKEHNNYWLKVIDNCGGFVPIELKNKKATDFCIENFEKIKFEEVERYKTKPDSIVNGKKYSFMSLKSHSPLRYFWFYKSSVIFKKFFDKYNLTSNKDSANINYDKNQNLALVELNKICEEIIESYVKANDLIREK